MAIEAAALKSKGLFKSRAVQVVLGLIVSIVCLWFAGRDLIHNEKSRAEFLDAFRTADYRWLPLLLLMLWTFYWLKAYRWQFLLSPLGKFRTLGDCFGPMISGFAINNVLPARAGELLRTVVFAKRTSQPIASVLATVALERIFDMLAILICLTVGLLSVPGIPAEAQEAAVFLGIVAAGVVAGATAFLIWTQPMVRVAMAVLRVIRVPEGLRTRIDEILNTAITGIASLRSPRTLAVIVLVSIVKWVINGSMMYLSLRSFGVQVPFAACLMLLGVVAVFVAVPTSPGFFGVIQFCFTQTLKIFPVPEAAVLAASIYYHMIQYIPVTIGGLLWLSRSGFRLGEVTQSDSGQTANASVAVVSPAPSPLPEGCGEPETPPNS